jgi:hypothetical protein
MAPESRDLVRGRGIGNPSARSRTQSDSCIPELLEPIKKEYRNEIPSNSRFIKYSSLRFKCNSLLHLNRGLPGSAVYDLSTVRHWEFFCVIFWSIFLRFIALAYKYGESFFCSVLEPLQRLFSVRTFFHPSFHYELQP